MATAATLLTFKLVSATRPVQKPAIQLRREKLVNRLCEQIDVAMARSAGTTFTKTVQRRVRDKFTGEYVEVRKLQYPKPWWFTTDSGKVCLSVKYGARTLELVKGKTAIEVASANELLTTLEKLKVATLAGELDALLESVPSPFRKLKH
jgi:hypothetical protein